MRKRKILVVGDFNVPTGYGYVNESIFARIYHNFDINVLSCNYDGFKPVFPAYFPVWGCRSPYALQDLVPMIKDYQPDIVYTLNDGYVMPMYVEKLGEVLNGEKRPVWIQHVVFDGFPMNKWADSLNYADHIVFPTPWQLEEVKKVLPALSTSVIWHGVDKAYSPLPEEQRKAIKQGYYKNANAFVFGMVGKNFQRKRFPELIEGFARFKETLDDETKKNVMLAIYTTEASLSPESFDILSIASHFGLNSKGYAEVAFIKPTRRPFSHTEMNHLYNSFDVNCLLSYGEGYGLPLNHACAVGAPSIVCDNSVMRELNKEMKCLHLVEGLKQPTFYNNDMAHIRYLPDVNSVAKKMEGLYEDMARPDYRENQRMLALDFAKRKDWDNIAVEWAELFANVNIDFPNRGVI